MLWARKERNSTRAPCVCTSTCLQCALQRRHLGQGVKVHRIGVPGLGPDVHKHQLLNDVPHAQPCMARCMQAGRWRQLPLDMKARLMVQVLMVG